MVRMTGLLLAISLLSPNLSAQVYPVLHDADDKPIGYVVSIESTPDGSRYIHMVSRQGYLATVSFERGATDPDQVPFFVGHSAVAFYESRDCTGDPVLLPWKMGWRHGAYTVSQDTDLLRIIMDYSRDHDGGLRTFYPGDMLNFLGVVYSAPPETSLRRIFANSYLHLTTGSETEGACQFIDRCDDTTRRRFPHILSFLYSGVLEDYCPEFQIFEQPQFWPRGLRLSKLSVNDPSITGFQSTGFRYPVSIKYLDIETLLKNGFETPP